MSNKYAGVDFSSGLDPRKASQVAHRTVMVAAKNMTAIAYLDALNETGKQWARDLGLKIDFDNSPVVYNSRMLLWNGTPYLTNDDFEQCLALLEYYNEFEPQTVAAGLRSLINRHPAYKFTFSLAREYSPAIYFRDTNYNRLDEIELANLGVALKADDAGYAAGGDHRLWWN